MHLAVQVDLVIDQSISAVHARRGPGNSEGKIGECGDAVLKHDLAGHIGEHGLGIHWILLAPRTGAELVHVFLSLSLGEFSLADSKGSHQPNFFQKPEFAGRDFYVGPQLYRARHGRSWRFHE